MVHELRAPGSRICVVGNSGSGKTTVAQMLAGALNLTYISNDAIIWRPNWQPAPRDEVLAEAGFRTAGDRWTYDGNLGRSANDQLVLSRCDTLVWLDLPRREVWSQVVFRTLRRLLRRQELWHGNVERWSMLFSSESIVWWSIKRFAPVRSQYSAVFADPAHAHRTLIRLRSRREVDAWLRSLGATQVVATDLAGR